MEEEFSLAKLLKRRKFTRAISELLYAQAREYIAVLGPLLRPRSVFGEYAAGSAREALKGPDQALQDLQRLWQSVAMAKPFNLPEELKPPFELAGPSLEFAPFEYVYTARDSAGSTKAVTVAAPCKWVLNYPGAPLKRVRELVANKNRSEAELRSLVLHALVLHVVVSRQPGLVKLLSELHYRIGTEKLSGLGELPTTCIASDIQTKLPPDELIIAGTELAGTSTFEEVVDLDSFASLRDGLKERIAEMANLHGEEIGRRDV